MEKLQSGLKLLLMTVLLLLLLLLFLLYAAQLSATLCVPERMRFYARL